MTELSFSVHYSFKSSVKHCKTDTFPSSIIWQVIFIHISLQHNNYRYDLPAATHFYVSSSQLSDADESILPVTV